MHNSTGYIGKIIYRIVMYNLIGSMFLMENT